MAKLELLTLLYSLEALMDTENYDKAKEVVKKVIAQAEDENKKNE